MGYSQDRESFLLTMQSEGMPAEIARRIMRWSNNYQRLAVASCNGVREPLHFGFKANGDTRSGLCGQEYDRLDYWFSNAWARVTCPDCLMVRAERLIRQWCDKANARPHCPTCRQAGTLLVGDYDRDKPIYQCDGDTTRREGDRYHRWSWHGFEPVFQGDPRGACVKIRVPSGRSDSWDRDGVCVPTRRY